MRLYEAFILSAVLAASSACRSPVARTEPTRAAPSVPSSPAFSVIESELVFVVVTPDAPRTSREGLLAITDHLHATRSDNTGQTLVIFRDPTRQVPKRRLGRGEQFGFAFAIGRIDSAAGLREVRTD